MDKLPLESYKDAARLYCKAIGADPDERVTFPHPQGYAVHMTRPQWQNVADEMSRLDLMMRCVDFTNG